MCFLILNFAIAINKKQCYENNYIFSQVIRTDTVMNVCLVYHHIYRMAKCFNHNVFLAPRNLLVAVDSSVGVNMMGGLDASGIDDTKTGCLLPPHQLLKHAFQLPLVEVVEDGVVGREILWQHSPLATCFQHIHDGIHDEYERVLSLSVLRLKDFFSNLPLFISKVSWILFHNSN